MESWWDLDERSWHYGSELGTSTSVRTAAWTWAGRYDKTKTQAP